MEPNLATSEKQGPFTSFWDFLQLELGHSAFKSCHRALEAVPCLEVTKFCLRKMCFGSKWVHHFGSKFSQNCSQNGNIFIFRGLQIIINQDFRPF